MTSKKFILWGATGHAKILSDIIELRGDRIVALFENSREIQSPWPKIPLYYGNDGFLSWLNLIKHLELPQAALAIGGSRGNDRCKIAKYLKDSGLKLPKLIHPKSIIAKNTTIGEASQILAGATVCVDVIIDQCVIVNTNSSIDHECHLSDGVHIAPGTTLCGCVEIGKNTLIGPGTTILPRACIGSNSIIGAGSVVTRNIPDNVIAWGSPTKVIRRNQNV